MKATVALSLTTGMYHQSDKALRDLLIREAGGWQWLDITAMSNLIWSPGLPRFMDLTEWLGIEVRNTPRLPLISVCHQVVNVYKHGDGDAHQKLVSARPEYYLI